MADSLGNTTGRGRGGTGGWPTTPNTDTRFVYDGWNLILELDALNSNAVKRKFTWGLDHSGSRQGAGGIGGLLAVEDANNTPTNPSDDLKYVYFHDANGNVGQFIDWRPIGNWQSLGLSSANDWHASRLAARYEYDAYGNSLLDPANSGVSGPYAAANPFRFSTKYCEGDLDDTATSDDLYYYGYRYYRSDLGRWVNRDPIEERGGLNIGSFSMNSPTNYFDALGKDVMKCCAPAQSIPGVLHCWLVIRTWDDNELCFGMRGRNSGTDCQMYVAGPKCSAADHGPQEGTCTLIGEPGHEKDECVIRQALRFQEHFNNGAGRGTCWTPLRNCETLINSMAQNCGLDADAVNQGDFGRGSPFCQDLERCVNKQCCGSNP